MRILFVLICCLMMFGCVGVSPTMSRCESKSDLDESEIIVFDELSRNSINYFIQNNSNAFFDIFSIDAKESIPLEHVNSILNQLSNQFGESEVSINLVDIFKIHSKGIQQVICTDDLSDKKNNYFVNVLENISDFVVTIHEVKVVGGESSYYIFDYMQEDGAWKLIAFRIQPMTTQGKDSEYYLNLAEEQENKGNYRNSLWLYFTAGQLLLNNPLIAIEYTSVINEKINSFDLNGIPTNIPVEWTVSSGETFSIYKMGPHYAKYDTGLQIWYLTESLEDSDLLRKEADLLGDYVVKEFPEYKEMFSALIFTAGERIPGPTEVLPAYNSVYNFDEIEENE